MYSLDDESSIKDLLKILALGAVFIISLSMFCESYNNVNTRIEHCMNRNCDEVNVVQCMAACKSAYETKSVKCE